ncbi:hypothetical protein CDD80_6386 [Ophiocordyceps camponoti-rufipedis]|uniref:Uncharacterized protein n=1 Tax=Ophiocordyceps camponoti-rufipedis TaxID=2004952 RepID=A0A2C5YQK9_9HYPO|nr:hypothetical protein CDD80_6386 [Ophiocordyceps camponoti-rufipedis]
MPSEDGSSEVDMEFETPLFAHEAFGEYKSTAEHADTPHKGTSWPSDDADEHDPTLERFPSEWSSVLEALRKIRSGYESHSDRTPRQMTADGSRPTRTRKGAESVDASRGWRRSASLGPIAEEPRCWKDEGIMASSASLAPATGSRTVGNNVAARSTDDVGPVKV